MKIGKKEVFIINCTYFVILLAAIFAILKYGLPMVTPPVTASVIAYLLEGPICFLSGGLHLSQKVTAILLILLFYSTAGFLIAPFCIKMFSQGKVLIVDLPAIYTNRAEPVLARISSSIEQSILRMDLSLVDVLEELEGHFVQPAGQMVSGFSISVMGWMFGFASSLLGLFINLLLIVITTFFTVMDYNRLASFCLLQMGEKSRGILLKIQAYVVGTLFMYIRPYALTMPITSTELTLGLTLVGVEHPPLTAFPTAVFDILPVLGTGSVMIPWTIVTAIMRDYKLVLGLLTVYLAIMVIHNIIEPKIVGSQIGLHPVVMLVNMFVGAQFFGVLGLLGLSISLSLPCHLNDIDTVRLFRIA